MLQRADAEIFNVQHQHPAPGQYHQDAGTPSPDGDTPLASPLLSSEEDVISSNDDDSVKDKTVDPAKLPQECLLSARVIGSSAEELGPCGEKRKIAPTKATKHTRAKRTGLIIMQY